MKSNKCIFSSGKEGLGPHIRDYHANVKWTCQQTNCSSQFSSQKNLSKHIRNYHQRGRFACAVAECHFEADRMIDVQHHQEVHANYTCSFDGCNKTFTQQANLKKHERIHSNIKPYGCKQCEHRSVKSSDMKRHIRNVHKLNPDDNMTIDLALLNKPTKPHRSNQ